MYRKLDNESWKECINDYMNNQDKLTVPQYCKMHNLRKEQFYYHRRNINLTTQPILQAVKIKKSEEFIIENKLESSQVEIAVGKAKISIPVSETVLITSIIKELVDRC